nr:AAA family ATPase [Streptomyces sp. NRRL B-1381]
MAVPGGVTGLERNDFRSVRRVVWDADLVRNQREGRARGRMGLHISRIEINNFRNFQHLVIDHFPAHAVIVGENGVGKSNLLEAIRLVLDPSLPDARRLLREEDIWEGHPTGLSGQAEVSVVIELQGYDTDDDAKGVLATATVDYAPYTARLTYRFAPRTEIDAAGQHREDDHRHPDRRAFRRAGKHPRRRPLPEPGRPDRLALARRQSHRPHARCLHTQGRQGEPCRGPSHRDHRAGPYRPHPGRLVRSSRRVYHLPVAARDRPRPPEPPAAPLGDRDHRRGAPQQRQQQKAMGAHPPRP